MASEGKHAPWRLWILIVLWVLQLILLGYSLIVYIIALIAINSTDYDFELSGTSIGWVVVNMVALVGSLAFTIAEIVQTGRHKLTPKFYVISNTTKSVVWIALTVVSLVVSRNALNNSRTAVGITVVASIIMLLLFILPMIYGIIILVKQRKGRSGAYKTVDPLLNANTAYSAQAGAPGNVELESQIRHPAYVQPQKDARFEAYRQSAVPEAYGSPAPAYGGPGGVYDGTPQHHYQQQQQQVPYQQPHQTGYVS